VEQGVSFELKQECIFYVFSVLQVRVLLPHFFMEFWALFFIFQIALKNVENP